MGIAMWLSIHPTKRWKKWSTTSTVTLDITTTLKWSW